jgi:hypothetical protein
MKRKVLWAGITGWMVGSVFVYLGGEGTEESPYWMATKGEVVELAAAVNGGEPQDAGGGWLPTGPLGLSRRVF